MAFARKLTDEQIAEIIQRRSTGESYKKIAADYDISGSRVYELTHPEVQAAKQEKVKQKNAEKRALAKAAKAEAADSDDSDVEDMDLSEIDGSESESGEEYEDLGLGEQESEDEELVVE